MPRRLTRTQLIALSDPNVASIVRLHGTENIEIPALLRAAWEHAERAGLVKLKSAGGGDNSSGTSSELTFDGRVGQELLETGIIDSIADTLKDQPADVPVPDYRHGHGGGH